MSWTCKKCKTKNNNSSLKCHGPGCKGTKLKNALPQKGEKPQAPAKIKRIYDFCLVCKKDVVLIQVKYKGENVYRCTNGVHRLQRVIGKTKEFPPGLLEELEAKDLLEQNISS